MTESGGFVKKKHGEREMIELLGTIFWAIGFIYRISKPTKAEKEIKELLAAADEWQKLHSKDF